jgi:DNA-directed RNA polymerase subunit K/omega
MKNNQNIRAKKPDGTLSLDRLLPNAGGSIFCLARIAMQRSTEIYDGSPPLIDHLPLDKSTTIALKEIAAGRVVLKTKI